MRTAIKALCIFCISLVNANVFAQDSAQSCKVAMESLAGKYAGKCKNGFADGKGEASGKDKYEGFFKFGLPNGKGTYHYGDSVFHTGNFQDGLKEGKGEMHYVRAGAADSVIKGYWSGDEYRGKDYKTYNFFSSQSFDSFEIIPSDESGNTITIEISTTSGAPNGAPTTMRGSGFVLVLTDLISTNGQSIRKTSGYSTASKSSSTYHLDKFPAKLYGTLSNNQSFSLELYKASKWMVRFYVNR